MKPEVEIYDTTLRDGSQGEGINFSAIDKLRIAEKLDQFGIHYIEGGWPGQQSPKTLEVSSKLGLRVVGMEVFQNRRVQHDAPQRRGR